MRVNNLIVLSQFYVTRGGEWGGVGWGGMGWGRVGWGGMGWKGVGWGSANPGDERVTVI